MQMQTTDNRRSHEWIAHEIRPMVLETDLVPVIDSWHKSHHSDPAYAWIPPGVHGTIYRAYVLHALETGIVKVSIAHIEGEPDAIIGWIATTTGFVQIHYVYVKQLYRRMRIATSLVLNAMGNVTPALIYVTHIPRFIIPNIKVVYTPSAFFTAEALEWMGKRWAKKRKQLIEKDRKKDEAQR